MDAKRMGLFICEIRKEKNMTQLELANRIHVSDKTISRWERGVGFPDIQLLEPISNALEITVAELIDCKRKEKYTNLEVTDLMNDYDLYKKECFKQDHIATNVALIFTVGISVCVYFSGYARLLGALLVGAVFSIGVVSSYYLIYEKKSKRIYAAFVLSGIYLFVQFLIFMGMNYKWICYILEMIVAFEIYFMMKL